MHYCSSFYSLLLLLSQINGEASNARYKHQWLMELYFDSTNKILYKLNYLDVYESGSFGARL